MNNEIKIIKNIWRLLDEDTDFYHALFKTKIGMREVSLPNNDIKILLETLDNIIDKLNDDLHVGQTYDLKNVRIKDVFTTEHIINNTNTVNSDCRILLHRLLYLVEYHSLTRFSSGNTRVIKPYIKLANLLTNIF